MNKNISTFILCSAFSICAFASNTLDNVLGHYVGTNGNESCSVDIILDTQQRFDGINMNIDEKVFILLNDKDGNNLYEKFAASTDTFHKSLSFYKRDFESILRTADSRGAVNFQTSNSSLINNGHMDQYAMNFQLSPESLSAFEGKTWHDGLFGIPKNKKDLRCINLRKDH